jgi:hypothetical protein
MYCRRNPVWWFRYPSIRCTALHLQNTAWSRYETFNISTMIKKKIKFSSYIKSYMTKGFLIYEEMRKYFPIHMRRPLVIYDFATAPFWISFYMRKFDFLFYQCIITCNCAVTLLVHLMWGPVQYTLDVYRLALLPGLIKLGTVPGLSTGLYYTSIVIRLDHGWVGYYTCTVH